MSKRTTILGTACVLGMALAAGQATAATLTDWALTANTSFSINDNNTSGGATWKGWLLGGSAAGPINGLGGMNVQIDGNYTHNWATHESFEQWNLGISPFWAGMDNRVGVNVNYDTVTHAGSVTNFGVFGEQYFGNVTGMVKGGYLNSTGSEIGGHGNYLGAALAGYFVPDLAVTGSFDWADLTSGRANVNFNRGDVNLNVWGIMAEWLFSEDYGVSVFGGYAYDQIHAFGDKTHDNVWHVGFRWYMGGGSLVDHHRNGNLNPWLPGTIQSAGSGF
ncbi:MAG TPA: hypothetical protein VNH44_07465 [Micropepsaceae bacterium]|nr:hypothetical protein [Micropepsaceae bacterium]